MQELDQDKILSDLTNQDYKYGFTTDEIGRAHV